MWLQWCNNNHSNSNDYSHNNNINNEKKEEKDMEIGWVFRVLRAFYLILITAFLDQ